MKKTLMGLSLLAFGMTAGAQKGDYYVVHGADVNITHNTHYPKTVSIEGTQSQRQELTGIATAIHCPAYFDKTGTVFEVKAGDIVTPNITINGAWMHGYVYVDWNNSKQFEVNLLGDGPYTMGDGNELMCFSHYNHRTDPDPGNNGWNSDGQPENSGNVLAPGTFRVPADLEVGSTYRMRYKVQWNNIDPSGPAGSDTEDKFISDGGCIIDVTLKISGVAENVTKYPIDEYVEPRVGTTPNTTEWNAISSGLHASWTTRDDFHSLHNVPTIEQQDNATVYAWKGERANIQAVLFSKEDQGKLSVRMTEWTKSGQPTGITDAGQARFVNYVITDDFKSCGNNNMSSTTWLVPDVIDQDKPHAVPAMETRPVWCTLEIPRNAEAGEYKTSLEVVNTNNQVVKTLNLTVVVDSHSLPEVADQKFHLDLWQQPYSVSRYYEVDRWSDGHIEALRPYLAALGRAGQRTVTAIMFYEPWGEQTHDLFDPMVQTTKKADGTWAYDYTIFDKYVELCNEYGINRQINCFSMVPWDMSFRYWDEASNSYQSLKTDTNSDEYRELWTAFLTAFKAHLQEKGWFEKTNIAMDERAEAAMLKAYEIASVLGFNMALAGNYHSSLSDKLQDYCVALGQDKRFTAEQRADRKSKNRITTVYTSCADTEPNIYSNSLPAEATYLPLYAAANDLNGYLHWSWINWDEHPLTDSRFRKFGAGDTYCYYPGNRSSIRFERLIEGIHQYEKVMILKEEYKDNAEKMALLDILLKRFQSSSVAGVDCAQRVNDIEAFLNGQEQLINVPEGPANGYYRIVSKETARKEYTHNNALLSGNSSRFTLQSDEAVTTNNGIWRITNNGFMLGVLNGDGNPMIAGTSGGGSVAGTFPELTIAETKREGNNLYLYFSEAVNCTNNTPNFQINGTNFITTWTGGASSANDLLWRFEPVSTEGKTIYSVEIDGEEDIYITYTHGSVSEYAFNGGFFITDATITDENITVGMRDGNVISSTVTIEDNNIKVTAKGVPNRQDLFNTSKLDGILPPFRIPGICKAYNGRLIATVARLVAGTDPGFGQVDVVCRVSDDNGLTWSDVRDVAVGTGRTSATVNYFDTAFGDPAVVADRTSSEVMVMAVAGCTLFTSPLTNRDNPNLIAIIRSNDNGETWEEPENVTEPIYSLFDEGNYMNGAFVGGGKVFQSRIVKKDKYYRVYAALAAKPNGNRVIYSDDFGRTWHALGGKDAAPVPGGDEPKCEELPDGRVIITSRTGGGRLYNIFNYTNTLEATGEWETSVKCTFDNTGLNPSGNPTNGELLILPVRRKSDNKDMYLALQSQPTGSGRYNVSIFYKELSELTDMNSVANFSTDWNGSYQVSHKWSAYSSLDLQADGKVAFFYEENLTAWDRRPNPVTTTNPEGTGMHNYDGCDNIYVPLTVEQITADKYSYNATSDRRAFLKEYFYSLVEASTLTSTGKAIVKAAVDAMSETPTTQEIDNIYALIKDNTPEPEDKWNGKTVTITNLQQDNTKYTLYIDNNKTLSVSTSSAERLASKAEFLCTKQASGKYSLYNDATKTYMIWRSKNTSDGYNSGKGTLDTYNATYCDWEFIDASSTKDNTYYIVAKRGDGKTDGSLILLKNGTFDAYGKSVGWSADYSNLFQINVKNTPTDISSVSGSKNRPGNIYDMTGRKVSRLGKGVYIVDGRKIISE